MSTMPHILIVDDDLEMANILVMSFKRHAYQATALAEADKVMAFLDDTPVALVVIDFLMPVINGLSLSQMIKNRFELPIIMLTAVDGDEDKIIALETHVDDYLTKPFNFRILLARANALIRRQRLAGYAMYHFSGWQFDATKSILITPRDEKITLVIQLKKLLEIFIARPGYVYTRQSLLEALRGISTSFEERRVDNLISQLRHLFNTHDPERLIIETVRSQGYRLNGDVSMVGVHKG